MSISSKIYDVLGKDSIFSSVGSGESVFGLDGDDSLLSGATVRVDDDGLRWSAPSLLSGGAGDDRYSVGSDDFAVLADDGSGRDYVRVNRRLDTLQSCVRIDDRHLFLTFSGPGSQSELRLLIVDAFGSEGSIEKMEFDDDIIIDTSYDSVLASIRSVDIPFEDMTWDQVFDDGRLSLSEKESSGDVSGATDLLRELYKSSSDIAPLALSSSTAQLLYSAYYGRPSDVDGLRFWQAKIDDSGFSYSPRLGDGLSDSERPLYDRIVIDFGESEESRLLYAGKTKKESADVVYNFCFNRNAEIDPVTGVNYWVDKLERNDITLSQLAAEVALGARGDDLSCLTNKTESANRFYQALDTLQEQIGYAGTDDCYLARNWLATFGQTVATLGQADDFVGKIDDSF